MDWLIISFQETKPGKDICSKKKEEEEYSGIAVMSALNQYYRKQIPKGQLLDSRLTRMIMEHKYCMYLRADYLQKKGYADQKLSNVIRLNYEDSTTIHLLGIKLNVTGEPDIYRRIDMLLQNIVKREQEYLPMMITAFHNFTDCHTHTER